MRKWLGLLVVLGALVAVGVAPASSSASNCQVGVSPFIESSLFGGPEVAAQVTFFNCVDVEKIKVRYQYNGTLAVTSGVDNFGGSNVKPFHVYQGINACGSNGLKPVPPPPPASAGTDFVCSNASGTICGSLAAGCSMWGYSVAGVWWTGCRQILASFRIALKPPFQSLYGPFSNHTNVATLCT